MVRSIFAFGPGSYIFRISRWVGSVRYAGHFQSRDNCARPFEWSLCSWVTKMPSTWSGRARPSASNRLSISFFPSPASMRRVVHPDSSNVELPVLPEARMDMRNEIGFPQCWRASEIRANAAPQWIMANCGTRVNTKSRIRHRPGAIRARRSPGRTLTFGFFAGAILFPAWILELHGQSHETYRPRRLLHHRLGRQNGEPYSRHREAGRSCRQMSRPYDRRWNGR